MSMQAESLEVLEKANLSSTQARAIVRANEIVSERMDHLCRHRPFIRDCLVNASMQSVLVYGVLWLLSSTALAQAPAPDPEVRVAEQLVLAKLQIADGEIRDAQASILTALEAYEGQQDTQPTSLVDAYLTLGDAYQINGEHELALGSYSEAREISRREFGLFNVGLVEVLLKIADSMEALGDSAQAIALHREAVGLVYRAHGSRSIQGVEATQEFADRLTELGYFREGATQYLFASQLAQSVFNHDPSEVVHLINQSADSLFHALAYAPVPANPQKPEALIAALRNVAPNLLRRPASTIVMPVGRMDVSSSAIYDHDRNDSCVDLDLKPPSEVSQPMLAAEILRDIGDWCIALDIPQRFGDAHVVAWDLLSVVENGEQLRQEWFAVPTPLYLPPLQSPELSEAENAPIGRIELEFTVKKDGTVGSIDVIASYPEGLLERAAKRSISNARFRPRMEEGSFVAARAMIAFEFRYIPE